MCIRDRTYTFPGDGDGQVTRILSDLRATGYDGLVSIEPHMAVVFHDTGAGDTADPEEKARLQYENYVEYGRRMEVLMSGL